MNLGGFWCWVRCPVLSGLCLIAKETEQGVTILFFLQLPNAQYSFYIRELILLTFINILKYFNVTHLPLFTPISLTNTTPFGCRCQLYFDSVNTLCTFFYNHSLTHQVVRLFNQAVTMILHVFPYMSTVCGLTIKTYWTETQKL